MLFKVLIPVTILVLMDTANTSKIYFEGSTCTIPSGEVGVCTQLKLCKSIYEDLLSRRITIQDPSLFKCGSLATGTIICCPDEKPKTTKRKPQLEKPGDDSVLFSHEEDDDLETIFFDNNYLRKSDYACDTYIKKKNPGWFDTNLRFQPALAIGGFEVFKAEFPHMAGIGFQPFENEDYIWKCGGSLISEYYILTAAHCVINNEYGDPKLIRLGTRFIRNNDDEKAVDYKIKNVIAHPGYDRNSHYHDIALIELEKMVEFWKTIFPACLHNNVADLESSTILVATGWGTTTTPKTKFSDILLKVNLEPVDLNDCNITHNEAGFSFKYGNGIQYGQICAFDPAMDRDSCQGDSGGPLQIVLGTMDLSTIVGITSFGLSCASAIPSVYTRVAFYLDWIEPIVWPSETNLNFS